MNKQKKSMEKGVSLLDNPSGDTQVNEKLSVTIFRAVFIFLLFVLISIGFIFSFIPNLYLRFGNKYVDGVFDSSTYYETQSCDLIIINPIKIEDLKSGDIICYETNIERGSGKFIAITQDYIEIENNNNIIKINKKSVVGVQVFKIQVVGLFIKFIFSYYGAFTFSIILLLYVSHLTFRRINYENTKHGIELYELFKKKRAEQKQTVEFLHRVNKLKNDNEIVSILCGNYLENKEKFNNFNYEIKGSLKDKYKYLLSQVYDEYMTKSKLSKINKRQISSIVELMCECKEFDIDVEYMLVDLILKDKLYKFDVDHFIKSIVSFLKSADDNSVVEFGSVLYVLLLKNSNLRDKRFHYIVELYMVRYEKMSDGYKVYADEIADGILKLF